jgi:hypothetical protein
MYHEQRFAFTIYFTIHINAPDFIIFSSMGVVAIMNFYLLALTIKKGE